MVELEREMGSLYTEKKCCMRIARSERAGSWTGWAEQDREIRWAKGRFVNGGHLCLSSSSLLNVHKIPKEFKHPKLQINSEGHIPKVKAVLSCLRNSRNTSEHL